jgi:hypothetical protein
MSTIEDRRVMQLESWPPRRSVSLTNEPAMEDVIPNVTQERLHLLHQYWNAANYLTVGQIYLQDNPLLKEPLRPEHIKPRLLGHWGTSPGLSFMYVHLNRLIQDEDVNMIYLAGPGHGGPAIVANVYLEGTYTEIYPEVTQNKEGIRDTPHARDRQGLLALQQSELHIYQERPLTDVGGAIPPTTGPQPRYFVLWFEPMPCSAVFPQVAAVSGHAVAFLPTALRCRTRTLFSSQGTERIIPH